MSDTSSPAAFSRLPCGLANPKLCAVFFALALMASAHAAPPGSGWTLTFSDEFNNQSAYDSAKWSPKYISGSQTLSGNGELEWYVDSAANIDLTSGSTARLTALKNNPKSGYTYSSGMLSSHASFNQAFGYFECRAKVPSGKGLWPAFWCLVGSNEAAYSWPPEIDIMEYIGAAAPKVAYLTNHYSSNYPLDGGNDSSLGSQYNSSQDLSLAFHTFAVLWEPDKITWYVDDVPRYSTTAHVPYLRAMHVILNLAVGGYWPGNPDANTVFPAVYEVDYVRVYTKPLPSPWQAADIGAPSKAGRSYTSSGGLFNVYGSGSGITGSSDQLHFAYVPLNGDGTVIARVYNEVGTNSSSVAANVTAATGLMIRESLAANARNVLMALRPVVNGTAGGNVFSCRTTTSGTTTTTVASNSQGVPCWLKLTRSGTLVTGYSSPDGVNWTLNGSATISMAASVYAGFAATGSSSTKAATAQFDNISLSGSGATAPMIILSPPSATLEPGSAQQFSATAYDASGNAVTPQPAFSWSISAGGSIDSNGLLTAGTGAGGPYTVSVTSGTMAATAPVTIVNIPNGPTNLTATAAIMLNGYIKLTWTNNSSIETGYVIERLNSGATFSVLATVGPNVTTYTNTGLTMPSGPYTYRVLATGTSGDSAYSNEVSASLPAPPDGPTGLTATPGNGKVTLTWNAVPGASNYNILRAIGADASYSTLKNNNSSASYTDSTVASGTTYFYKVNYNVNSVGSSLYCAPVSASPIGPLATVAVSPGSAPLQVGGTQQFTATGYDASGVSLLPQPAFTWSVTGGGTISSTGLLTATSAGGPFSVNAVSTGVTGTASVTINTPFDAWKATHFGANANNPGISGATVTNNSAGITNLMAYALGLDPFAATIAQMPTAAVVSLSGTNYLALRFPRNTAATDITYVVQGNNNLADHNSWGPVSTWSGGVWSPSGNVLESGTNPVTNIEVRDSVPVSATPRRFLRLEVMH